jgi:hypothetical protein
MQFSNSQGNVSIVIVPGATRKYGLLPRVAPLRKRSRWSEAMTLLKFRYTFAFSRRDAPELCKNLPPMRAWGMPGAQCTRSLACEMEVSTRVSSPQVHRNYPAFPHAMVLTASFGLSPVIGLSCHRRQRIKVLTNPVGPARPPLT